MKKLNKVALSEVGKEQSTDKSEVPRSTLTEGQKIWNEIKDKKVDLFALPSKTVADYCKLITLDPKYCFLLPNISAAVAAIEQAIGTEYTYEVQEKYILIGRK